MRDSACQRWLTPDGASIVTSSKRCHLFGTLVLRAPIPVPVAPPLYPEVPKTLGEHLKKRRIERGMSTWDLAGEFRVCQATINNWEGDRSVPAIRFDPAIARFLERDLRQLYQDGIFGDRPIDLLEPKPGDLMSG